MTETEKDKEKKHRIIDGILEAIKKEYNDPKDIVIGFRSGNDDIVLIQATCPLCAIEEIYKTAIEKGAKHIADDNAIASILRSVFSQLLNSDALKDANKEAEIEEILKSLDDTELRKH